MKKIKIKCIVCNSLERYYFHIKIYNVNNKLIAESNIDNYKPYIITIPYNGIYKVRISNYSIIRDEMIIINEHSPNTICYYFYQKKKRKPITIILTDKNYKGLPIEKGEIALWNTKFPLPMEREAKN